MNFNEINTAEFDKNLPPEELKEWNAIYASYRSGSLMSGVVTGVDSYALGGDGKTLAVVVIPHRVKILIPESLIWHESDNIPEGVTRNLLGAKIEFVITNIDRENSVCTASRIAATQIRRRQFFGGKPKTGDIIKCNVLAVGIKKILVEVGGFDLRLRRQDLCYTAVSDFRTNYIAGQTLAAVITNSSKKEGKIAVSVRDAKTHPYIGIRKRHPINSRRPSVITGKYKGSIFCRLEDDFDCLCTYSEFQKDEDFEVGDRVLIIVKRFNDESKRVFGVIVSKWK
jgi:ribosomal protein S1